MILQAMDSCPLLELSGKSERDYYQLVLQCHLNVPKLALCTISWVVEAI